MQPNIYIFFLPVLVVFMGVLGLGLGMIISSMVTKYRDLTFLVSFGVQLLMYMSAVMYPIDLMKDKLNDYSWIVDYNPMAHIIEMGRFMILNEGTVSSFGVIYTVCFSIVVLLLGIVIFNRTEKSFIDTI